MFFVSWLGVVNEVKCKYSYVLFCFIWEKIYDRILRFENSIGFDIDRCVLVEWIIRFLLSVFNGI